MKQLTAPLLSICFAASTLAAASLPKTSLQGDYIEARTADVYTAACFANSEAGLVGNLAVFGWRVNQGEFQGVKLDGLSVVGVVKAKSTLGDIHSPVYPVKSVLIIDERATPEQRFALQGFAKKMSGDLLQDIVKVESAPIQFAVEGNNIHAAAASLSAGTLAAIKTRAVNEGDQICHNEVAWYPPLTKVSHAMPAVALAHRFDGKELGTTWSSPNKRSAFVGQFNLEE